MVGLPNARLKRAHPNRSRARFCGGSFHIASDARGCLDNTRFNHAYGTVGSGGFRELVVNSIRRYRASEALRSLRGSEAESYRRGSVATG